MGRTEMEQLFRKVGLKWERDDGSYSYRYIPLEEITALAERHLRLQEARQDAKLEAKRLYDGIEGGSTDTDDLLRFVKELGKD